MNETKTNDKASRGIWKQFKKDDKFMILHLDTEATSFSVYKEHIVQLAAELCIYDAGEMRRVEPIESATFNEYIRTSRKNG